MSIKIIKLSNLELQFPESENIQEGVSGGLLESVVEKFKSGVSLTEEERSLLLKSMIARHANDNCNGC